MISWQFIILLLHVSTLLCHLQGGRSQSVPAKLYQYVNAVLVIHLKFISPCIILQFR